LRSATKSNYKIQRGTVCAGAAIVLLWAASATAQDAPPEETKTPSEQATTPPKETKTPPRKAETPPEKAETPPKKKAETPPEKAETPPEKAEVPPKGIKTPPAVEKKPAETTPEGKTTVLPDSEQKNETPPDGMTPDPKARATQYAKEGAELARKGLFRDATSKFQQSLSIHPLTDVMYNLAYCYEQLAELKGCVNYYTRYLNAYKADHDGADPPEVASIKRSIIKCTEKAQPPITITSNPSGARVSLDNKHHMVGTTPHTQKLTPGNYKLYVTKDDYTPVETSITIMPKQQGKFHFDLKKIVKMGKVKINVNVRDATIYINGKNYGISPFQDAPELEIGIHQIVVKKDRYTSVNKTFEITENQITTLDYKLFLTDPPPSWRSYLGWTFATVGVISVAGGIVAFKFAETEFVDTDDFKNLEFYQNLGYGLGGGLLGVATTLLIWEALTDAVDSRDLVGESGALPRFQLSIVPTQDSVFFGTSVRF